MTQPQDGGPAFPGDRYETVRKLAGVKVTPDGHEDVYGEEIEKVRHPGMSLRDWFAGQALMGSLANPEDTYPSGTFPEITKHYARLSYHYADAMIAERNKP